MNIPPLLIEIAVKERARHKMMMTHDIYGKGFCMICNLDLDYQEFESHLAKAVLTKVFEAMQASAKIVRQILSEVPT